jgi:hypothetical protein
VGSIGVVFQKLKLKGLLDHFDVDHKHFATNEYTLRYQASCSRISYHPTKTSAPPVKSI